MKIIYWFVFFLSFHVSGSTCNQSDIEQKLKTILDDISKQNDSLENIIKGVKVQGYSISNIFGHDFELDQTQEKINNLNNILNYKNGISSEVFSTYECLKKLNQVEDLRRLKQVSIELIQNKIKILEKNLVLGDSLRNIEIAENNIPTIIERNESEAKETVQELSELEDTILKNRKASLKEDSSEKRFILNYKNELNQLKVELLSLRLETNKSLERKIKLFEEKAFRLGQLSSELGKLTTDELRANYKTVEELWGSLLNENYYDLLRNNSGVKLPNIPKELDSSNFNVDLSEVNALRLEVLELRKEIVKNYTQKKNQELIILNQLVVNSNRVREAYFDYLGNSFILSSVVSSEFVIKLKDEVFSSPYRIISYFFSFYLFFSEQINLGKEGLYKIVGRLLQVIFLIICFYLIRFVFYELTSRINRTFEYTLRKGSPLFGVRHLFSLWNKINDNFVSILWIFLLYLLKDLEYFHEFHLIIKLVIYYFLGAIIKSVVTIFLGRVSRLDSTSFVKFKEKAGQTSNKFKNIFLFYFISMILIEATVGKVYLYTLLNILISFYSLYQFIKESHRWEKEFSVYSERMFSGVVVEKFFFILNYLPKNMRASFILFFIIILMGVNLIIGLTENFEISKKISANVFKKQIEKIEASESEGARVSESYKAFFDLKSNNIIDNYINTGQNLESKVQAEVVEWIEERSEEHSAVIYGDKGIGKTTLLKHIGDALQAKHPVDVEYFKIPSKSIDVEDLHQLFNKQFGMELSHSFDLAQFDSSITKKKIIILDECQNLFLAKTGGYNSYHEFINIINQQTKNIFWIMSFNKYSWLYLDRAFGRIQFFRNIFEVKGWNDNKIKELIMNRHNQTGMRLSYDLLISATRSQDEIDRYSSVESKFFKLLWELSRGNPRAALYLWVSALSKKNNRVLNVNVPKDFENSGVDKITDELSFVLSHVLKHENLSLREIVQTTNLQKGIVENAIRIGLERKFLYRDERHRYMVDISNQYSLIRFLKVKNFIYGN